MKKLGKAIFNNLSWKILNETEEDEDTATVEVEITNKDFATIINNFKQRIVKAAFGGESIDEAKTQQYLLEEINNAEIENVTNKNTIKVEKKDGKWQVSEENDIINMLLPGFIDAINSLS